MVSKTSLRVAARAVCRAPASTGFSVTPASSSRGRVSASEPTSSAIWSRRRVPPAVSTPPARTTSDGSTTETTAAMPSANRSASVASSSSPGPGVVSALATAACGVLARSPSERARVEHRAAAGQLLEAAGVAAAYVADQRGAGERQEADLPGTAGGAAMDAAVDDDGRAHPFVRPQKDEVLYPRRQPRAHLGDRGEVHVVGDLQRRADRLGEPVEQVRVVPAGQVPGVAELPVRRVERARRADGEPVQPVRGRSRPRRRRRRARAARGAPRRCRPCAGSSARSRRWCGR